MTKEELYEKIKQYNTNTQVGLDAIDKELEDSPSAIAVVASSIADINTVAKAYILGDGSFYTDGDEATIDCVKIEETKRERK